MSTGLTVQLCPQQAAVFYYRAASLGITMLSNTNFSLSWQGETGQLYTVQATTNLLAGGDWISKATNIAGTGGINSWTGQVSQATEFFRVKHQ